MDPVPTPKLVDTLPLLESCIKDLMDCKLIAVHFEGRNLSRHGSLALVQLYRKGSEHVWLVDVTVLKEKAFDHEEGVSLRDILEDEEIRKASLVSVPEGLLRAGSS
jgi:hypothetical protein